MNLNSKVSNLEHENLKLKKNGSNSSTNDAYYKQQIQSLNSQINNLNSTIQQKNATIKNKDNTIKELQKRIEVLNSLL